MAIFGKSKAPPPSASVATDAIEQSIQVAEDAGAEKDRVAESAQDRENGTVGDQKEKEKEAAQASLVNYFVSP